MEAQRTKHKEYGCWDHLSAVQPRGRCIGDAKKDKLRLKVPRRAVGQKASGKENAPLPMVWEPCGLRAGEDFPRAIGKNRIPSPALIWKELRAAGCVLGCQQISLMASESFYLLFAPALSSDEETKGAGGGRDPGKYWPVSGTMLIAGKPLPSIDLKLLGRFPSRGGRGQPGGFS